MKSLEQTICDMQTGALEADDSDCRSLESTIVDTLFLTEGTKAKKKKSDAKALPTNEEDKTEPEKESEKPAKKPKKKDDEEDDKSTDKKDTSDDDGEEDDTDGDEKQDGKAVKQDSADKDRDKEQAPVGGKKEKIEMYPKLSEDDNSLDAVAKRHQIKIAKQTLNMPDAIAAVMGGPSKEDAREILKKFGVKFTEGVDLEESLKVGSLVIPKIGPHAGQEHKVIHVFADGKVNITPTKLQPNRIRYALGAVGAWPKDLTVVKESDESFEYLSKLSDKELSKRLDVVRDQQQRAFAMKNTAALQRLQDEESRIIAARVAKFPDVQEGLDQKSVNGQTIIPDAVAKEGHALADEMNRADREWDSAMSATGRAQSSKLKRDRALIPDLAKKESDALKAVNMIKNRVDAFKTKYKIHPVDAWEAWELRRWIHYRIDSTPGEKPKYIAASKAGKPSVREGLDTKLYRTPDGKKGYCVDSGTHREPGGERYRAAKLKFSDGSEMWYKYDTLDKISEDVWSDRDKELEKDGYNDALTGHGPNANFLRTDSYMRGYDRGRKKYAKEMGVKEAWRPMPPVPTGAKVWRTDTLKDWIQKAKSKNLKVIQYGYNDYQAYDHNQKTYGIFQPAKGNSYGWIFEGVGGEWECPSCERYNYMTKKCTNCGYQPQDFRGIVKRDMVSPDHAAQYRRVYGEEPEVDFGGEKMMSLPTSENKRIRK